MVPRWSVVLIPGVFFVGACVAAGGLAETPTRTPEMTASPARARPTITDAPDVKPDRTRVAVTPTPTALTTIGVEQRELGTEGPWLLLLNGGALYAFNRDGTGQTKLVEGYVVSLVVAPGGGMVSYIADMDMEDEGAGLELRLLDLRSREDELVTRLQNPQALASGEDEEMFGQQFESMRAISESAPQWSHGGDRIAFIGQMDGPSADLYVYSMADEGITRLSDGPSHASGPSWSPDDKYVFHIGVWNFGTGAGYNNAGSWVARADGSEMYETTTGPGTDAAMRWMGPHSLLMGSWSQPCGLGGLRVKDFLSGEETMVWEYALNDFAYSSETGQMVIMVPPDMTDCGYEAQPTGLFLLDGPTDEPLLVSDHDYWSVGVDPSDTTNFLLQEWEGKIDRLLPSGEVEHVAYTPPGPPVYSQAANLWAWHTGWGDEVGAWIGPLTDQGPQQIFDRPVDEGAWSPDGGAYFFVSDDEGYVYMALAPEFKPVLVGTSIGEWISANIVWVDR